MDSGGPKEVTDTVQENLSEEEGACVAEDPLVSTHNEPIPTTIQGRLARAKSLKQEGNDLFRVGGWKKAIRKYHHALMYCKGITDKLDFIPGLAAAGGLRGSEEEEKEASDVTVAVTNNLAACLTHMKEWDKVIHHCDKVLKVQPENSKALYRRGVARLHIGLLDGAQEDLMAAKEITPNDKDVKLRLQEIAIKSKEYVQKEKKLYSAMFNMNS